MVLPDADRMQHERAGDAFRGRSHGDRDDGHAAVGQAGAGGNTQGEVPPAVRLWISPACSPQSSVFHSMVAPAPAACANHWPKVWWGRPASSRAKRTWRAAWMACFSRRDCWACSGAAIARIESHKATAAFIQSGMIHWTTERRDSASGLGSPGCVARFGGWLAGWRGGRWRGLLVEQLIQSAHHRVPFPGFRGGDLRAGGR